MKTILPFCIACFAVIFFSACGTPPPETNIELNNGKKWEVNAEMKPHIEKANQILNDFISTHNQNYNQLANDLMVQNNALINSCTMKGANHDALHQWLMPHIGLIKQLKTAENYKEAQSVIAELEKSFEVYSYCFK